MVMQGQFAVDVAMSKLTKDQLMARIAHAQLYLIEMEPEESLDTARSPQLEEQHLRYLCKLEQEGRLYGFGPVNATAVRPGYDLAIIAAASRTEAEKIAANEPYRLAGLYRNRVRGHKINEGVACYVGLAMAKRMEAAGETFDAGSNANSDSREELLAKAVGAQLQLIYLTPTSKLRPDEDTQSGIDHFVWLRENEMKAKLMSCGPVEPPAPLAVGIWGGGMGVFAVSQQEAEAIAATEPSGRMGYRSLSVATWTLNYGLAAPIGKALEAINSLPNSQG